MLRVNSKILLSLMCLFLLSTQASADWQLSSTGSSLYYVTSKSSAVSEVNSFTKLSGSIDNAGNAVLSIDLASVDTAIDVRNQRVRDMLFQVVDFPEATATLQVDTESLEAMATGLSVTGSYQVNINLHGISQEVAAELQVTKLNENNIQIQLAMPLIISASTFGMSDGIEELREVAGLPSINSNVIISMSLLFMQ
jgi:polyisoprenoid-binding protein YceI